MGFAEQSVAVDRNDIQIIEVSARIRSQNVMGKGAGINVGVYDSSGNLLFNADMGYATFNWIHGTTDWKRYTVSALCPEGTSKIKIGAILYGKGEARFDDYRVKFTPIEGRQPSDLAMAYVSAACDTIARRSLVRDSVNIDSLRLVALQIAGPATTYGDCHLAVEYLLSTLRGHGDDHSFFMGPREVVDWQNDTSSAVGIEFARSKNIEGCGYILVPPFHGGNQLLISAYCDTIQSELGRLDRDGVKGWIVDLRQNTGGNMEPMVAGLGPLFDRGKLGSLVDVDGLAESWSYRNGAYCWDDDTLSRAPHPVVLSEQRPIAVLIGPQTGSSGEAITISFVGNSRTVLIGQPTWGLTTGNGGFDLPDSARMMLASTIMADRTGKLYRGKIQPDVGPDNRQRRV